MIDEKCLREKTNISNNTLIPRFIQYLVPMTEKMPPIYACICNEKCRSTRSALCEMIWIKNTLWCSNQIISDSFNSSSNSFYVLLYFDSNLEFMIKRYAANFDSFRSHGRFSETSLKVWNRTRISSSSGVYIFSPTAMTLFLSNWLYFNYIIWVIGLYFWVIRSAIAFQFEKLRTRLPTWWGRMRDESG